VKAENGCSCYRHWRSNRPKRDSGIWCWGPPLCPHRGCFGPTTYITWILSLLISSFGLRNVVSTEPFHAVQTHKDHTTCEAHPTSYAMGTGALSPGGEADHSPPSSAEGQ
jgi:hypothetical protein